VLKGDHQLEAGVNFARGDMQASDDGRRGVSRDFHPPVRNLSPAGGRYDVGVPPDLLALG
jgi:hypothetical protein